jgi:hypothetical protein
MAKQRGQRTQPTQPARRKDDENIKAPKNFFLWVGIITVALMVGMYLLFS